MIEISGEAKSPQLGDFAFTCQIDYTGIRINVPL